MNKPIINGKEMIDFDKIKEEAGANEIIFAQHVGSWLYGAQNPHDDDVVIVVDERTKKINRRQLYDMTKMDIFVYSIDEERDFVRNEGIGKYPLGDLCCFLRNEAAKTNYLDSVLYGEGQRKINMWDNSKVVFEKVLQFGKRNFFNDSIRNARGNNGCAKMMSWALWYYYSFQNGSIELTNEQKTNLQLCHDGNLPIEHMYSLRKAVEEIVKS